MNLQQPRPKPHIDSPDQPVVEDRATLEFYVERDGARYAGVHLLVDLYGGTGLNDPDHIEDVLRRGATDAGAIVLSVNLHHFSPEGVSGVAVLAESHISIHSWPEAGYAALDVFMCGDCDPHAAIKAFREGFATDDIVVTEKLRGKFR